MVSDALRRVMLAAEGSGDLAGEGVRGGRAEHPVCGDVVELQVRLLEDRVAEVAWRASGCVACMAVTAAAWQALPGSAASEARFRLREHLDRLGGLQPFERHAENLVLRAFAQAIGEEAPSQ